MYDSNVETPMSAASFDNNNTPRFLKRDHDNNNDDTLGHPISRSARRPSSVRSKANVGTDLVDFSGRTSAHGIPHIGASSTWVGKMLWTCILLGCAFSFGYNAYWVLQKFSRNEKNVNIEVKYMSDGYPAVTICNLNPYKNSLIQQVDSLRSLLELYESSLDDNTDGTVTSRNDPAPQPTNPSKPAVSQNIQEALLRRFLRNPIIMHEVVFAKCSCSDQIDIECYEDKSGDYPTDNRTKCLCAYEQENAWPCYSQDAWNFTECDLCDDDNRCRLEYELPIPLPKQPCVCSPHHICIRNDKAVGDIRKLWVEAWTTPVHIPTTTSVSTTSTVPTTTTHSQEYKEAMGFEDLTDTVAINTRAKENIMFAVQALPPGEREKLSYKKMEFITKCSYNGKQCDIERDFQLHADPTYGNCFTFNYDTNRTLKSSKSGPNYGLRLMVMVNISDYLPTSEAGGVRISIHEKTAFPFPDTFGFNAPTGFMSSFGLSVKRMQRLGQPYGNCIDQMDKQKFIYDGYEYSVEACYRSCFQFVTIERCGCADPRFPAPNGTHHCSADDPTARNCLFDVLNVIGDFHTLSCDCPMSCKEFVIWAAFSTARWPSGASKSWQNNLSNCGNMTYDECFTYYKTHAAMIEVFLEKLSYEDLEEFEAYGWVNVIADFGGQIGLWMGFSVITCFEFLICIWNLLTKYFCPLELRSRRNRRNALDF